MQHRTLQFHPQARPSHTRLNPLLTKMVRNKPIINEKQTNNI